MDEQIRLQGTRDYRGFNILFKVDDQRPHTISTIPLDRLGIISLGKTME